MLRIRKEQMEALKAGRRTSFYWELLRECRLRYPALCAGSSDARLLEIIQLAAEKAEACGLFLREHIGRFVFFAVEHGPDFEKRPDMARVLAVLNDPDLVGPQKLDRIEQIAAHSNGGIIDGLT
jgi:hypothetical protein